VLIAAIDPGLRECGVAVADGNTRRLRFAFLARNPEATATGAEAWERMAHAVAVELEERLAGREIDLLVVERQYIGRTTPNPFAMLGPAYVVGALVIRIRAARKIAIMASTWKGSESKKKNNQRTMRALTVEERETVEADGWLGHNAKDAVGIAKWAVGKFAQESLPFFED
jgi:Holliday junction resolvasome RuvABC endonuclease subunit